ncbi:MAG: hypothetical protein WD342_19740 [Verrucomicrobiales bacterium]
MKLRLIFFAGLFVVGGLVWNAGRDLAEPDKGESLSSGPSPRSDWTQGSKSYDEVVTRADSWGDASVRLGLSFIGAMIAGSFARAFFKTAISIAVVAAGTLWFLEHRGVIDPFWKEYYGSLGETKDWVVAQTDSARAFLKGYIPSAGAALVGFGFGLRK